MKISREEYREAVDCLKEYNYNYLKIVTIQDDILSLSIPQIDGIPKAPYKNKDTTLNKVLELEGNPELHQCLKEYKAVIRTLVLVDDVAKQIFEEEFQKRRKK